jgi:tRNA-dihydrouridine synthase B
MTEFTSADGLSRMRESKRKRYLSYDEDEHPISAQLFGSDPVTLAEAARIVEDAGFDMVDLNLGCPAKRVVSCNGGSGLLRDLPHIATIFERVRAAVRIPFTVKFRMGWSDQHIVCVPGSPRPGERSECGRAACAHPGAGLLRPGALGIYRRGERRRPYPGHREWRYPLPGRCVHHGRGNRMRCGDDWPRRAGQSLDLSPDRAIHGLRQLRPANPDGPLPHDPRLLRHADGGTEEDAAISGRMKQFASWFTHGVPGGAILRKSIYEAKSGDACSPRWMRSLPRQPEQLVAAGA